MLIRRCHRHGLEILGQHRTNLLRRETEARGAQSAWQATDAASCRRRISNGQLHERALARIPFAMHLFIGYPRKCGDIFLLELETPMMTEPGSITRWVRQLEAGQRAAVRALWEAYFPRLVVLARRKLQGLPPQLADAEDVALSAFQSFCQAAEQKRFPRLDDRDDLWQILVLLIRNKSVNLHKYHQRDRRDHRRTQSLAGLDNVPDDVADFLEILEGREPDPAFAAEMAEQCQQLLGRLPDEQLRQIAQLKLEGYTNQEIAERLQCAPATVDRRLARIRLCWNQQQG
jgi:RNA polymerase sigma factor (sigma-70 family)